MAEDWTAIADEVAAALADVGFTATLHRPGAKDDESPEHDPVFLPGSDHPVTLMLDSISLGLIDGSSIQMGDKRVMMAADGVLPTTADRITLGGSMQIIRVEPFAPGGVDLFYELLLRS